MPESTFEFGAQLKRLAIAIVYCATPSIGLMGGIFIGEYMPNIWLKVVNLAVWFFAGVMASRVVGKLF